MPSINNFLQGFTDGLPGMKDFRHASRLYLDDNFRLAPKNKFLYHVVFDINDASLAPAMGAALLQNNEKIELNMLVKAIDLPKYNFNIDEKIQYNKKTYIGTKIGYEPINVTFHDDYANTVNAFWKQYYEYMIADPLVHDMNLKTRDKDTLYDPTDKLTNTQFGMDNAVQKKEPMIRGIEIFVLHKQTFTSIGLINPIIGSFSHDTLDQADGQGVMSNTMQILYEGVVYGSGLVKNDGVPGFASLHYDHERSPLDPLARGTDSIFGRGGILDGIGSVIRAGKNRNYLGAILGSINTYNRAKRMKNKKGAVKEELKGIVKDEIKKVGESAGTIANPVGDYTIGNAVVATALAGATIAGSKGLIDGKNSSNVVNSPTIDTVNYLSATESFNLLSSNATIKSEIAASMYYKDIGSRKGLTVAESNIEYNASSDSVKTVYTSKASTNIKKLVNEGYIRINRSTQDVSIAAEKANL